MNQSIREQEDALFAEWAPRHPRFIRDGAADDGAYAASTPKLLFILKEVNDPDLEGEAWDLRNYMREGGRSATWSNVARWAEGLRDATLDRPWAELSDVDEARRITALKSIAAMNLKKTPGGAVANKFNLFTTASEDRSFLSRQFALYDADIVVCCGTDVAIIVDRAIELANPQPWRLTRRGVEFREYGSGKVMITHTHPTARVGANLLYYGLIDAVREILGTRSPSGLTA